MSRSRKKTPVSTVACCKSQKWDKRIWNHTFRRKSKTSVKQGQELPYRTREIVDVWDFSGDGKCYWGFDCKYIEKILRK